MSWLTLGAFVGGSWLGLFIMGDLFHPNVPETFISAVFYVMQKANRHTFLVLTKRPKRMLEVIGCDGTRRGYYQYWWQTSWKPLS